jgi:hypothetical protein
MANKYPSRYSNGKTVSAAQYITEIICEKRAKKINKDLHYRFWLNKDWAAFYRNQIATANKLLLEYSDTAIVKALNNKKSDGIYSLRAPHLKPIIDHEQKLLDASNKNLTLDLQRLEQKSYRKSNHKNILSKLKDIDDVS